MTLRLAMEQCHRPAPLTSGDLPAIDGDLLFDSPENINALMARHNIMRQHSKAQDAALDCYQIQAAGGK